MSMATLEPSVDRSCAQSNLTTTGSARSTKCAVLMLVGRGKESTILCRVWRPEVDRARRQQVPFQGVRSPPEPVTLARIKWERPMRGVRPVCKARQSSGSVTHSQLHVGRWCPPIPAPSPSGRRSSPSHPQDGWRPRSVPQQARRLVLPLGAHGGAAGRATRVFTPPGCIAPSCGPRRRSPSRSWADR